MAFPKATDNAMRRPELSLKGRALRYLSMREHSRLELARKLFRYAQEGDDIEALLDWLEQAKFLSQGRFVDSLIHRRSARFGNQRIVQELQSHGVQGEELGEAKAALAIDEVARARQVWQGKFGVPASDAAGRAKQMRFLLQRGFSYQAVRAAMKLESDEADCLTADSCDGAGDPALE